MCTHLHDLCCSDEQKQSCTGKSTVLLIQVASLLRAFCHHNPSVFWLENVTFKHRLQLESLWFVSLKVFKIKICKYQMSIVLRGHYVWLWLQKAWDYLCRYELPCAPQWGFQCYFPPTSLKTKAHGKDKENHSVNIPPPPPSSNSFWH